jgi:hypothetical protein
MQRFSALLLFSSILSTGLAQEDGKAELRAAIAHMQQIVETSARGALTARMDVTSITGEGIASTMVSDLFSSVDGTIVENEHFTQFEDDRTRVVLIHSQKVLLVYDRPEAPVGQAGHWQQFSDTLIDVAHIEHVRRVQGGGKTLLEIGLIVPDNVDLNGVSSITYTVDREQKLIVGMRTTYRPGRKLSSYRMHYLSFEPGRVDPRLKKGALYQVFNGRRLRAEYARYSVRDHRTKANHHAVQRQN